MNLTLSRDELLELQSALDLHLQRLAAELYSTDDALYAASLRQTVERLDHIRRQLELQTAEEPVYA